MPSSQEIVGSLYGAWRVLRMDPAALGYFNQSIDGFWRSFFAIVLVVPIFAVVTYLGAEALPAEEAETAPAAGTLVFIHLLGLLLAWAAFPASMIWLSRMLKLSHRYVLYIIVWNWSNVVSATIFLMVMLLLATGLLSAGLGSALSIFAFGYVLFYSYLVARAGLDCTTGTAVGIVIFEFVLEHVIDLVVTSVLQPALS